MSELILVCGMPGSGKTTFARKLAKDKGYIHLDVDDYYYIVNGDSKDRSNKFKVWMLFFETINCHMEAGDSVVIDTMALTPYNRQEFIQWFPNFDKHIMYWCSAPFLTCVKRVSNRERTIPRKVMEDYFIKSIAPSPKSDGKTYYGSNPMDNLWDEIHWKYTDLGENYEEV